MLLGASTHSLKSLVGLNSFINARRTKKLSNHKIVLDSKT